MNSLNWTTLVFGLGIAGTILWLIRKDHLHSRYALWWLPVAVGVALFGAFPGVIDIIAPQLGIAYPPVLLLSIGFAFLLIKILLMDIERSRNETKLLRLMQRLAMLEERRGVDGGSDERNARD